MTEPRPSGEAPPGAAVLYIHPDGYPLPMVVPIGALSCLNALDVPKLGVYQHEATDEQVRAARVVCLSLHWYMPLARVRVYARHLRRTNPDASIVLGGLTADLYADLLLEDRVADYVVVGDAEVAFVELVDALLSADPDRAEQVRNVRWRGSARRDERRGHDDASYAALDWFEHAWFPSFALWARIVHERFRPGAPIPDHCFPTVPLMRGCEHPCQGCYGAYQRPVFQRPVVGLGRDAVRVNLERIEGAGYRFASFTNGLEILEALRGGPFGRRHALGVNVFLCFLPEPSLIENLCDSFSQVAIWITYPEDDLLINRLQLRKHDDFLDRFYLTLAKLERDNVTIILSRVLRSDEHKRAFEQRLARAPLSNVELVCNYDWDLPIPRLSPLRGESLRAQYERFTAWSSEYQTCLIAARLMPELAEVFAAWEAMRDHDEPPLPLDGDAARLQTALAWRYLERALPGVAGLVVELYPVTPAHAAPCFEPCAAPEGGVPLAVATLALDAHVPVFRFSLPSSDRREWVLIPRVQLELGVEATDIRGCWALRVRAPVGHGARSLELSVRPDRISVVVQGHDALPAWRASLNTADPVSAMRDMLPVDTRVRELECALDALMEPDAPLAGWSRRLLSPPGEIRLVGFGGAGHVVVHPRGPSAEPSTRLFRVESQGASWARDVVERVVVEWEAAFIGEGTQPEPVDSSHSDTRGEGARRDAVAREALAVSTLEREFAEAYFGGAPPLALPGGHAITRVTLFTPAGSPYLEVGCTSRSGTVELRVEALRPGERYLERTAGLALSHIGGTAAGEVARQVVSELARVVRDAEKRGAAAVLDRVLKALRSATRDAALGLG